MTLQNFVTGCSRKRLRQYNMYLREEHFILSGTGTHICVW